MRQLNRPHWLCFLAVCFMSMGVVQAAVSAKTMPWPEDKKAALTFTIDDGQQSHAEILAPLFSSYDIPVTFYLIAGQVGKKDRPSWDTWKALAKQGHEIGNHSWSHSDLTKIAPENLRKEIDQAQALIAEHIGVTPRSYAYPFCKFNDAVKTAVFAQHESARAYHPLLEKAFNRAKATKRVQQGIAKGEWVVWLSHGMDPTVLEAHLSEDLAPLRDDLWCATFADAAAYQQAVKNATWSVKEEGDVITLSLKMSADQNSANGSLWVILTSDQVGDTAFAATIQHIEGDFKAQLITADGQLALQVPARDGASITLQQKP